MSRGRTKLSRKEAKERKKKIKNFNAELIPMVFWRCPICKKEDALIVTREKRMEFISKTAVKCKFCSAVWRDMYDDAMTLVEGPDDLLGTKSMKEWAELASGEIYTEPTDIHTSVLLKKDETPIKAGYASLYQEKTKRVRSGGGTYGGVSIPILRTKAGPVRIHTGGFHIPATFNEISEMKKLDEGEFVITNKRVVFNGDRKSISMDLKKLVSVEIKNAMLKITSGKTVYFFDFSPGSPFKWQAYINSVYQKHIQAK